MMANPKKDRKQTKVRRTIGFAITFVIIGVIVAGGYLLNKRTVAGQPAPPEQREQQRIPVITTSAAIRDFQRIIAVQGNVEAKNFAFVSPRIPGTLEAIFVDEGDTVVANETRLFQTDDANLKENVEIGRHNLTIAQCSKSRAMANLEKTKADLHKTKLDYERFKRLLEKEAVTADMFEQQESRYLQLQATERLNVAELNLAAAQQEQAQASLAIAEKNLADTTVYTPISGKVSSRLLEPGEMGNPGMPVLRIDDMTVLEVAAFLPAQHYADIISGQTSITIQVAGIDIGQHAITYKSPTIHPKLRTFEVKCLLTNPPDAVAPGAMAQIGVILESRKGLGVPSAAIQQRGGNNVVFTVKDNISRQVTVQPGIEMEGWTEIREGQISENTPVVTMGQYLIEEGTPVAVQKERE
jgi:RND family efflux transporter MFP subunit